MQRKPPIEGNDLNEFIMGAKDEKNRVQEQYPEQEPVPIKEIGQSGLRRQTYYITELYIAAIKQMAFYEEMDKSELVRKALEQFIPEEYIELAAKKTVKKHK